MAKKPLNAEEIAELRESPFILSIISGRINFTPEFKQLAYCQLINGKSMREIFEENGIDPEILGPSRIYGFAEKLRTKADREEGFIDLRGKNSRKPAKGTKEQALAARVEQLEHEFKVLEKCDYLTYFLMTEDFISWARSAGEPWWNLL